ncbi:MAG: cytosylglucuronate decarboxylase [Desulfatitalea sp.]|nr:cytosylglucuronate decarboxylase [Desulfatitalea sp.]NNJ99531.1 cytosylglucuronate decarboxylase [Desulfatitalea sp.]
MKKLTARKRYLFIRILEACNAGCFMCGYRQSRDSYRITIGEFKIILSQAHAMGVEVVRFTGGEPLLHNDVTRLISLGAADNMKMSLITNGYLLPKLIGQLSEVGLAQVIVSIDGASADTHDSYRNVPGIFGKCMVGIESALNKGVLTRVNTVVGPHNYTEMPRLQKRLSKLGVQQWELSAIKLEQRVTYPDRDHVLSVCEPIYEANNGSMLVPMGKRFYGDTLLEQDLYFKFGISPRPSPPQCHLVGDALYLDAKAGLGFGCSLLPHRNAEESGGGVRMRTKDGWTLDVTEFHDHVNQFRLEGYKRCRSCSTTAAGYSDQVALTGNVDLWQF